MKSKYDSYPSLGNVQITQARHQSASTLSSVVMKSMTGFGRGEFVSNGTRYSVEIATVNRRNAEIVFNLPREMTAMESKLRGLVASAVARGRATVTASVSAGAKARPLLDVDLFSRLPKELTQIQRSLKISGDPALSDLVRLYTTTTREASTSKTTDEGALTKATRAAVEALEVMRTKEGAHLTKELQRLLIVFSKEVKAVRKLAPLVSKDHHAVLQARLAEAHPALAIDDDRLARELAIFADRADITEELSRLESHIKQFREGLKLKEAKGRSLDFLAQEMFRECNTIGAKANSASVTCHVVAAKTELERLREQVQNVE